MVEEVKDYLMAFGSSEARAEEIIQGLLKNDELNGFYNNMFVG